MAEAAPPSGQLRIRRVTRSIANLVRTLKVFFERERDEGVRISISRVRDRLVEATGLSQVTIAKINSDPIESFPDESTPEERDRGTVVIAEVRSQL